MSLRSYAKALGKKGGVMRAQRLSADKKKKIAALGGKARVESLRITKRIEENFRYLEAMQTLALATQNPLMKKRPEQTGGYIETVGEIVEALEGLGLTPVLIGGMALVFLGSRRVTRDFDFLVSAATLDPKALVQVFYQKGFELASKVNDQGDIIATLDNPKIAAVRLRLDSPSSVYFLNKKTGLRIDLLFDFPLPANELALRAEKKKIRSYIFRIASRKDLLHLKEIAYKDRSLATDAQDMEFLKKHC